jgi:hypothetical protein
MKLILIYLGLLTNKISVIGLSQTPQNFMRPFHNSKVTVWCAISSFGIIGPYFFEDERERAVTVTGSHYIHMLENFLGPELAHHPVTKETFFQQDGASSHTTRDSMAAVRNLFPNHVISRYGDNGQPGQPIFQHVIYFPGGI